MLSLPNPAQTIFYNIKKYSLKATLWLSREKFSVLLFIMFAIANIIYLDRVPGLLGDEGLEGINVFEIQRSGKLPLRGAATSYIGPFAEYLRIPSIHFFGFSTLGLRLPTFLASLVLFWTLWLLLKRIFQNYYLFALTACIFSPIFLGYQRLGWAISLLPLFLFLTLYLISAQDENSKQDLFAPKVLSGFVAGIGASIHVIFLALLPFIVSAILIKTRLKFKILLTWWVFILGFMASFIMQFTFISLFRDDQDRLQRTLPSFFQRLSALPDVFQHFFTGSSFVAVFTGKEFSSQIMWGILLVMCILIAISFIRGNRLMVGVTLLALFIHLILLNYIIGRITLRYFEPAVLIFWLLAGTGIDAIARSLHVSKKIYLISVLVFTIFLLFISTRLIMIPFLHSGGGANIFAYGEGISVSEALSSTDDLVSCLKNKGFIWSDSGDTINMLQYFGRSNPYLRLANKKQRGQVFVEYRINNSRKENELCPSVKNYIVTKRLEPLPD
jgi:hypothetical protein